MITVLFFRYIIGDKFIIIKFFYKRFISEIIKIHDQLQIYNIYLFYIFPYYA